MRKWIIRIVVAITLVLVALQPVLVDLHHPTGKIAVVSAIGAADYPLTGVHDNLQFQAALNALPATGGVLQVVSAVTVNFDALTTVTRAIDNVTIIGTGQGTYFVGDGVTAIFTAGGNNWTFQNIRTNASGINMGATTGWSWENVTINATYYAYRTDDLTTGSSWNIPTGRTATYVIAAYDSPIGAKAQADYVMPLATSDLGIVVTTSFTDGYNSVKLLEGNYQSTTTINIPSASYLVGSGMFTTKITLKADVPLIKFQDDTVAMGISDMTLDGDSNAYSATSHAITATGTVLSSNRCWIKQVEIDNFTGSAINLYNIQDCVFENIYIQGCGSVASTVYSITLGGTNAIGTVCNRFLNVTIHAAPYGYIYLNDYARDNVFINTKIDHLAITTALHGIYISGMINRFEGGISLTYLIPVFQISGANGKYNIIRDWYGEERKSPTAWGSSGVYMTQNIAAYNKVVDSVWTGFQRPLQTDNQNDEFIGNTVLNTGDVDLLLDTNSTNCVVTGNNFVSGKGLNIIGTGNKIYDNVGWITQNSGKATVLNTTTSIVVNHGLATTPTRVIITPRENPTNAVSFWWVDTLTATQFTINVNADPGASNLDFDWRAVIGEGN